MTLFYRSEPLVLPLRDRIVTVEKKVYEGCDFATEGDKVAAFTETFFKVSKGKYAREPLKVRPHQKEIFDGIFRLDPKTQRRLVRTAILKAPRKYGKSQIAAPLALYYLLTVVDSGMPEVYSVANDRAQASLIFNEVKHVVNTSKQLQQYLKTYRNHIEVVNKNHPNFGGIYRALAANADRNEGLNPLATFFDEIGSTKTRDLWDTMASGSAARKDPLLFAVSTPGVDKQNSLYGQLCEYGERVNRGEIVDPSFYYRGFDPEAGETADHRDPQTWVQCSPGLGDYLDPVIYEDNMKQMPESVFRRYYLAQWVSSADSWIPNEAWDDCADDEMTIDDNEDVVLHIDGSYDNDSTAILMSAIPSEGERVRVMIPTSPEAMETHDNLCLWEKQPNSDEAWRVPGSEVMACIRDLAKRYNVKKISFDPYRWQHVMEILINEGLPVQEYPQTPSRMVPASKKFSDAVFAKAVVHKAQPQLTRHLMNTKIKHTDRGYMPTKKAHKLKIDAAVSMVCAYDIATGNSGALSSPIPAFTNIWGEE